MVFAVGSGMRVATTLCTDGIQHVIDAMRRANVRRLVCISAAPLGMGKGTPWWQRLIIPWFLWRLFRHAYEDLERMEARVRASALDWTIIRAPRLTAGPHTGRYRVALDTHLSQMGVSRADVADYIVRHIGDPTAIHARVELAY